VFVRANTKLVGSDCHRDLLCCDSSLVVFSHQSYEVNHAHYQRISENGSLLGCDASQGE